MTVKRDGKESERVKAFKLRRAAEARQSANPNNGKRGAPRLRAPENQSRVRASAVTTSYLPGKTVAARLAGIQAHYDRAAAIAALN